MRRALAACAALLGLGLASAEARVQRLVVDATGPALAGAPVGEAGPYEQIRGRIFGELDPADPRNAVIQDIALAPRNAAGRVEYVATFTILRPADPARRNGGLVYQVVNRGNTTLAESSQFHPGTTLVESGWQGDLLANCAAEYPCTSLATPWPNERLQVLQVPVARNADGTAITGPVFGRILDTAGSTGRLVVFRTPLPYKAVTLDTSAATLRSIGAETIEGRQSDIREVPSADWAWADCTEQPFPGRPDPTRICLKDGFDPARSYEVTFPARDPLVLGIGFAATRDLVAHLREAAQDNPLAGEVRWTLIRGTSQSGNFLKSLLHNGFNESEAGRRVFDGARPHIAARQNPLNFRFALPDGATNLYEPGSEGVLWWTDYEDAARGRGTGSLLARCRATDTCPRIFETFGGNEVWYLRLTPGLIGTDARADLPLPDTVRRYYFPGTGHGGGRGGVRHAPAAAPEGCVLPNNPNPVTDTNRALLDAMVAWITEGREPPASVYPRLDRDELRPATREGLGFPAIPGLGFRDDILNPLLDYDFGPEFDHANLRGVITRVPPAIRRVIPLLAVRVDADGNEVAGVPSVLHQAPLGTYLGWNLTAGGFRRGLICGLAGGYVPFARTAAERQANADPRPSLQERYGTKAGYVCAVRAAAARSTAARFLRPQEAARLVAEAEASDVLDGVPPGTAGEQTARALCAAAPG